MGQFSDLYGAFRDFVTDGVPSSGKNEPRKAEIRAIGDALDDRFDDVDEQIESVAAIVATGIQKKVEVRVAAFTNVNLANALENGDTVNGVVGATGDRALLLAQSSGATITLADGRTNSPFNGCYDFVASGAAIRSADSNSGAELLGATYFVREGTTGTGTTWTNSASATITPDTTPLLFVLSSELDTSVPGAIDAMRAVGSDIASGTTVDLSAATGDVIKITGTNTIAAITGKSAGSEFELRFQSPLRLVHNDTSLILPGGIDMTVKADDVVSFRSLGSDNVICVAGRVGPVQRIDAELPQNRIETDPRGFVVPGIHVDDEGIEYHHSFDVYPSGAPFTGLSVDRRGYEIPQAESVNDSTSTTEALFTDTQYEYAQAIVDAERIRMANIDLSTLKRVSTGWRFKPRSGQSFEARDNIARLFLNNLRVGTSEYVYHAAMIGPDVGNVGDGTTFETFNSDDRDFWFLREAWTAGTNTDYVYTPAEIVDGDFASNSRAGGPAPLCSWARQWLRREWLQQDHDTADTTILDVAISSAKGEGTTEEVYGSPGKDRAIDMIRVFKEAITNNTVSSSDDFDTLVTLPSGGADKGVEIFHNLHGQSPNTDPAQITSPNDSYLEQITAFITDFSAVLADGTNGISQTELFAFTMMQPGAIGWSNTVNECANQMVDIMDDVTGDGKYVFLIGAMWDMPSKRTLPTKSTFTASATTGTLTVSAFTDGDPIDVGDWISTSTGIPVGEVTALGTGTGGTGTYTISLTTNFSSQSMKAAYDPDAGNGHPLLAGNIYMGCRQGIAEHYICDRQENFWPPKPMDGFFVGNKFLIPIASKFPGLHISPICIGVEPTILPHLGVSLETPAGSLATITSIRVVPGYDLIEGTVFEESLESYEVGKTGRYDGSTYFGVVCLRDGMTSNLPIKVPFVNDQRRAIGGYIDTPRNNGLGRHAEDIPGVVGEIDWGNPVMIRTFAMSPLNI